VKAAWWVTEIDARSKPSINDMLPHRGSCPVDTTDASTRDMVGSRAAAIR
jgi:hypothetical protein